MRGLCLAWRHLVVGFLLAAPLHAQVVINELLAVNAVTALDEAGSSSDWIELVNIGDTVVNLGGYSLTDAPGESRKWVLPQLDLGPGEYLLVWCSGKDIRAAPPEAVVDGRVEFVPTLVAPDVPWRYLVGDAGAADPSFPLGWETGDFDDSGWEVGLPGFGFGEDDLGTVLPEGLNAFLLRHRFDVSDPSDLDELYLQAVYDDGFLAFLNGEEVLRVNVTDGEQDFASQALSSHPDGVVERFRVTDKLHLLQPGENVLAIAVINRTPGRGDMNMIPELGEPGPLLHTDFRLSSSGETVLLFDASGGLASRVDLPAQIRDRSYGRVDSNVAQYAYLLTPTPLAPNDTLSSEAPIPIRPLITPSSGEFNEDFEARITLAGFPFEGAELHYYTLDGTDPRPASTRYDSPLLIESDTIVRATVFIGDEAVSEPATRSYFRDAEEYDLPILSVAHDDFELLHIRGAMESPAHATFLSLSGR
ncbi:MAG: lamin tail domain-containing protein, partial [Planctomycetes bacterium]|nr:lamin tail domain-containing protein [Planctomycetota bacterium]